MLQAGHKFMLGLVLSVLVMLLGGACGPAAEPTPTKAAPTPTTAAPAVVATPTPTASPVPTVAKPAGKVIIALAAEPLTQSVVNASRSSPTVATLSDTLTIRDKKTGQVIPKLAESWSMQSPNRWRFNLRKGVKFWNGELFVAAGVAADAKFEADPLNKAAGLVRYATGLDAAVVDDYTVDLICKSACPLMVGNAYYIKLQAPQWARDNPKEYELTSVSNGPYKIDEWRKGEFARYSVFDGYWGLSVSDRSWGPLPTIQEVVTVWRGDAKVRALMIAVGEAHFAYEIGIANKGNVPQTVQVSSGVDTDVIQPNSRSDPYLTDKRVRQALAYAIDRETITKTLFAGTTTPTHLPFASFAVGASDTLPKYTYNPAKARQLVKEAGAEGAVITVPMFGQDAAKNELYQAITGYWDQVGLKTKLVPLDVAQDRTIQYPGVGKNPAYSVYVRLSHTNDIYDASITLAYMDCRTERAWYKCDAVEQVQLQKEIDEMAAAAGAERQRLAVAIMQKYLDEVVMITLWPTPHVHGLATGLEWDPYPDNTIFFRDLRFIK